jgi:predicted nucleic acid-binding protein
MIVVDASVWVSYLLPPDVNHEVSRRWLATHLSEGQIVVAPVLLLAEVGGAIARQTRPQLGQRAIDSLLSIPNLRLVSIDHASGIRAARTAVAHQLRGADALYVETAATLKVPLVSWDRQQLDRAAGLVQVYVPE